MSRFLRPIPTADHRAFQVFDDGQVVGVVALCNNGAWGWMAVDAADLDIVSPEPIQVSPQNAAIEMCRRVREAQAALTVR